jgi:imidazolonepropionase-like amidohydrolase
MVDGPERVLAAARENLRLGASQLKLAIGGGVSSPTDPIDTTQFTYDEIAAAVAAAENWGTYVTVHGYTPRAINIAIDAGPFMVFGVLEFFRNVHVILQSNFN